MEIPRCPISKCTNGLVEQRYTIRLKKYLWDDSSRSVPFATCSPDNLTPDHVAWVNATDAHSTSEMVERIQTSNSCGPIVISEDHSKFRYAALKYASVVRRVLLAWISLGDQRSKFHVMDSHLRYCIIFASSPCNDDRTTVTQFLATPSGMVLLLL
jgi:hypothetical protein